MKVMVTLTELKGSQPVGERKTYTVSAEDPREVAALLAVWVARVLEKPAYEPPPLDIWGEE